MHAWRARSAPQCLLCCLAVRLLGWRGTLMARKDCSKAAGPRHGHCTDKDRQCAARCARLHSHCTISACKPACGGNGWAVVHMRVRHGSSLAAAAAMHALLVQYLTALLVVHVYCYSSARRTSVSMLGAAVNPQKESMTSNAAHAYHSCPAAFKGRPWKCSST